MTAVQTYPVSQGWASQAKASFESIFGAFTNELHRIYMCTPLEARKFHLRGNAKVGGHTALQRVKRMEPMYDLPFMSHESCAIKTERKFGICDCLLFKKLLHHMFWCVSLTVVGRFTPSPVVFMGQDMPLSCGAM
jgi:hypothetical protein